MSADKASVNELITITPFHIAKRRKLNSGTSIIRLDNDEQKQ